MGSQFFQLATAGWVELGLASEGWHRPPEFGLGVHRCGANVGGPGSDARCGAGGTATKDSSLVGWTGALLLFLSPALALPPAGGWRRPDCAFRSLHLPGVVGRPDARARLLGREPTPLREAQYAPA